MVPKYLQLGYAMTLFATMACDRNIGALPAHEPEYKTLFYAGTVTADILPYAKGVLFVAAAPANGGVPPLAARYEVKYWPVQFELSDLNIMGQGLEITGPHHLFARFDTDGDVGSRSSFDLEIRDNRDFAPGTTGITLVLTALGDAPAAQLALRGTIHAPAGVTLSTVGKTLYIFARGTDRPMPIAAMRAIEPSLPFTFVLDDSHILMRDAPLPDTVQIVARLDSDGDPVTKNPQDLEFTGALGPRVRESAIELVLGQPVQAPPAVGPQALTSPAAAKPH